MEMSKFLQASFFFMNKGISPNMCLPELGCSILLDVFLSMSMGDLLSFFPVKDNLGVFRRHLLNIMVLIQLTVSAVPVSGGTPVSPDRALFLSTSP